MLSRTMQLQTALSTAQQVANTIATTAAAVEILARHLPVDRYLRRRALVALGTRAAWGLIPVVAFGVGFWGVRSWNKRRAAEVVARAATSPFVPEPSTSQAHPG